MTTLPATIPVWAPRWSPTQNLVRSLYAAQLLPTGADAGALLAVGGWAVFPVPEAHDPVGCQSCEWIHSKRGTWCQGKSDQGPDAMSYKNASTDESQWWDSVQQVRKRHGVSDVNIAVSPWRCAVPMIGIDLDGPEAVAAFLAEHDQAYRWLRIRSSGKGGGRHVYIASDKPVQGRNPWGGEYRADAGHLMLPPSAVNGTRVYYRPAGLVISSLGLKVARGGRVSDGKGSASAVPDAALDDLINRLSTSVPAPAAQRRLFQHLDAISQADPGTRYPTTMSAVAAAVAMARTDILPLRWAMSCIEKAYGDAVAGESRDPKAQVRDMVAWTLGQELT